MLLYNNVGRAAEGVMEEQMTGVCEIVQTELQKNRERRRTGPRQRQDTWVHLFLFDEGKRNKDRIKAREKEEAT